MTFNSVQKKALETLNGPVLILAGAGTGKTRVLTHRIARLIEGRYCSPHEILAVTFTNKAAEEMKQRIKDLFSYNIHLVWVGTFHKVALSILRENAHKLSSFGFSKNQFIVFDQNDTESLIKELLKESGLRFSVKDISGTISQLKNYGHHVNSWNLHDKISQPVIDFYRMYQRRLIMLNALDFGDILLYALYLLESDSELLAYYHQIFRYILVDEYQDTNVVQYCFLKLLAKWKNICCVGDEDQSIYGWRGAQINNILSFEKDFPNACIIRLEQNYRSTGNILLTASTLISHNVSRLGKTLWTADDCGELVRVISVVDQTAEAERIVSILKHSDLQRSAVLVRMAAQTREIEESFLRHQIPYRIIGATRFYDRLEVRDFVSYLRLVIHPDHDLAFSRVINRPARGIGKKTLDAISQRAYNDSISQFQATRILLEEKYFTPTIHQSVERILNLFLRWIELVDVDSPLDLSKKILQESGLLKFYQAGLPLDRARADNLLELLHVIEKFDTLQSFLEHISLNVDFVMGTVEHAVSIMTMHAAKGLEFDTVFLPGWEDGIFPSQRALESTSHALEEERRLAYVSLTRAKQRVFILRAKNRLWHGQWNLTSPSRFLYELPKESVFFDDLEDFTSAFVKRKDTYFHVQQRCFHQKFGYGIIQNISGDNVTVSFDSGIKTILSSFLHNA